MRLRFTEPLRPEDKVNLKPVVGETVLFEGTEYVIDEVGLRYARMHNKANPRLKYVAKFTELTKVMKPVDGVNINLNFTP